MRFELTPEQERLRAEYREYFRKLMTPEVVAEVAADEYGGEGARRLVEQMGRDRLLGVGWPTEYGGLGRTSMDHYLFFEEGQRARAPLPMMALNTVGPTIMLFGSEEQRHQFLPAILEGRVDFAIGYTEPGAGTDLAGLTTTARRDADDYVINGAKTYTSRAAQADYIWLAARTDPSSARHRGISILLVDTRLPGITITPITTIADYHTYSVAMDDVRVPVTARVGAEHDGWRLITTQLNHERVGVAAYVGVVFRVFNDVVALARQPNDAGERLVDRDWVRADLAEAYALLDVARLLNLRLAWALENDRLEAAQASLAKVYSSEGALEVLRLLQEVLGPAATLRRGSDGALLQGEIEWLYRRWSIRTFGGGTNEIQRELIARRGLGMPRVER